MTAISAHDPMAVLDDDNRLRAALQFTLESGHLVRCPAWRSEKRDCTCGKEDASDALVAARTGCILRMDSGSTAEATR